MSDINALKARVEQIQRALCEGKFVDFAQMFVPKGSFSCYRAGSMPAGTCKREEIPQIAQEWLSQTTKRVLHRVPIECYPADPSDRATGSAAYRATANFEYIGRMVSSDAEVLGLVLMDVNLTGDGYITYLYASQNIVVL